MSVAHAVWLLAIACVSGAWVAAVAVACPTAERSGPVRVALLVSVGLISVRILLGW